MYIFTLKQVLSLIELMFKAADTSLANRFTVAPKS